MPDIKDIVAIAAAIVAASVAIFNWRSTRFRSKLKDDLDILKKYREELLFQGMTSVQIVCDKHYEALQASINRKIVRAYLYKGTDLSDVVIAASCLALTGYIWIHDGALPPTARTATLIIFVMLSTIYAIKAVHDRNEPRSN